MKQLLRVWSLVQTKLRRSLRWIWIYFLYCSGLTKLAKNWIKTSQAVVVLTLHRVLEDDKDFSRGFSPKGMVVRKTTFESLLNYLTTHCELIALSDAPAAQKRLAARPQVAISFDDGWKDTFLVAFPLMKTHKIPFSVFVCPGLMGKSFPFWPEKLLACFRAATTDIGLREKLTETLASVNIANVYDDSLSDLEEKTESVIGQIKNWPAQRREVFLNQILASGTLDCYLSEEQTEATATCEEVIALSFEGATIGSHTLHHVLLRDLPESELEVELRQSKSEIERFLKKPCLALAYPNGTWTPGVRLMAERAGYSMAFTNEPGAWLSSSDVFLIPRINIWEGAVTGPSKKFSKAVFEYAAYWRSYIRARMGEKAE